MFIFQYYSVSISSLTMFLNPSVPSAMSPHCLLAQYSLSLPQFNTGSTSSALSKYTALLHFTVLLLPMPSLYLFLPHFLCKWYVYFSKYSPLMLWYNGYFSTRLLWVYCRMSDALFNEIIWHHISLSGHLSDFPSLQHNASTLPPLPETCSFPH